MTEANPDGRALAGLGKLVADMRNARVAQYRTALEKLGDTAGRAAGRRVVAELRDKQQRGAAERNVVTLVAPEYQRLDVMKQTAAAALREAMTRCGILEHRLFRTGEDSDLAAYMSSLEAVDDAAARYWAVASVGTCLTRVEVERRRGELLQTLDSLTRQLKEVGQKAASGGGMKSADAEAVVALVRQRREVSSMLRAMTPLQEGAISVPFEQPSANVEGAAQFAQRQKVAARNVSVARKLRQKTASKEGSPFGAVLG